MTYAQCIEARRLLGLPQTAVGKATKLSHTMISNFESSGHMPRSKFGTRDHLAYLKAFFEKAGVEFTNEAPAGVRLRKLEP